MRQEMCAEEIKFRLKTEAGMSLAEFAGSIGRHPSTVSMVIHRRRTSGPIMEQIAKALDAASDPSRQSVNQREDAA